jgi:hypothetical protein
MRLTTSRALGAAAVAACCVAPIAAQGSDLCANAQPIAGTGIFQYDTKAASTDGPQEAFVTKPELWSMHNDVWFSWQAPKTAVYEVHTCFPPPSQWAATFMAVYRYGCPTGPGRAVEAKGGYGCPTGLFTKFELGAVAGETYLIRLGHSAAQNKDDGIFEIREVSPPAVLASVENPANGRTYHLLEPSSWTVAQAAARMLGGDLVTVNDAAEDAWLNATFWSLAAEIDGLWLGYNDAETEGVWEWISGQAPGYENWSTGAPNNGNQFEHYAHLRFDWTDGTWNDLLGFPQVSFFYNQMHGIVEMPDAAPLVGTPAQVSVAAGGTQSFALNAGPGEAGAPYLLLGTLSGTAPGVPVDGQLLPLNIDAYTLHTLQNPGGPPLTGSWGTLDAAGKAAAAFTLTPGQLPSLVGLTAHHAYVNFDLGLPGVSMASNAVAVDFTP